jgi:isoprenylcysteine carboxyl methyltransferase (ICMT) family protein YpbQ
MLHLFFFGCIIKAMKKKKVFLNVGFVVLLIGLIMLAGGVIKTPEVKNVL